MLTVRNFREARPRVLSRLNLLLTVVLALLAGLVWFQAERTEESVADFQGWIFFSTNYWMLFSLFGALFNCEFSCRQRGGRVLFFSQYWFWRYALKVFCEVLTFNQL